MITFAQLIEDEAGEIESELYGGGCEQSFTGYGVSQKNEGFQGND